MNETPQESPEWCRIRPGEDTDPIALRVPLRESMRAYVELGRPEGSFVEAVIAGDLFDAALTADAVNKHLLYEYVYWFYNYAPRACYGSAKAYRVWLAMHAAARHWQRHPPQVGSRVRTLFVFCAVAEGTEGVIDQLCRDGLIVAWDLAEHPLPPGYDSYDGRPAIQSGIVRDGFSPEELRFLVLCDDIASSK